MSESNIKKLFGYNLKKIRKERGLSQLELATRLDMHFTFISDIENGKKWVSPETISKLAKELNTEAFCFLLPENFEIKENPSLKDFTEELQTAFNTIKSRYIKSE